MKRLIQRLRDLQGSLPPEHRICRARAKDALAAALLHDLGHGPLSHLFEDALPHSDPHEIWTERIILDPGSEVHAVLAKHDPNMPSRVAELIAGRHELPYLARAVSGTFDVDRCDYLLRDAHATGVRYGNFDLDWLHRSLRFAPFDAHAAPPALAIDGVKGVAAIESFVLARLFMFQQVYFHKATRAAEWMVRAALSLAVQLLAKGVDLPSTPPAFRSAAEGRCLSIDEYLELDDGVLTATLHAWESCDDPSLADLCQRLRSRRLFKTIEFVGEESKNPALQQHLLLQAKRATERAGLDPAVYCGLDVASDVPFNDASDNLVVVFSKGTSRRPAEVSFLLSRLDGEEMRRERLIVAPEVREQVLRMANLD
ncbi:MAG TPA: HD domain-containing protein [Polyangiaceae bacterium]|nr:HD domain-containing protein [Polyangiaceae bacterium]